MPFPTPHGDKLRALLNNSKLPTPDQSRVRTALSRYDAWLQELGEVTDTGDNLVRSMVGALDRYKKTIDLELIFDSEEDFLYRQKGQLKIDNTVVEEFLPWLVGRVFAESLAGRGLRLGPLNSFAQLRFDSHLLDEVRGGGMVVRSKNQDFVMARPLFVRASHDPDFASSVEAVTHLAYVAAEIKTNLDKTMFQEAAATANDLKLALPKSRYFLLCEWLDMTPISTSTTAVQEVIILRKAKRLPSNVRSSFSGAAGRRSARGDYRRFLERHPYAPEAFMRFLRHIAELLGESDENEDLVLGRGWF